MTNTVNDQAVWTLRGNVAAICCGNISGRIDVSRPCAGLHDLSIEGTRQVAELLRVYRSDAAKENLWPLPVTESYIRGNDLVASYQPKEDWPFSPQLYWQANTLHAVGGVSASASLLVSVQTHLLDTFPKIAIASSLGCDETFLVSANNVAQPKPLRIESPQVVPPTNEDCCILSRLAGAPFSYVEIIPTGDFHAISLTAEGAGAAVEWRLFGEFLEKGVIRRARVHAAFVSRERDMEIAAACCRAIDKLELPLTA